MPLVLANRVQETTATTGTGTITLAGAVSGYQSFAAIGNGNTTYYTITSGTAWEVGIGTYSTTGPTLARTTILSSSAGGAAITLVGVSTVFSTYPANRSVNYDETNSLTLSGTAISAPAWTTTGIGIKQVATTYTDTTSTGTVPNVYINSFAAQTLAATNTITVSQLYGVFFNTPTAGTNVTATERWSIGTDTLRVTGGILMDGSAGNFIQIATGMTTGQFILGNTAGTGTMTFGRSTVTQTTNIQGGSTTSGNTKTINFGSGGLAGSTTNITIGSSAGTSTTTLNGTVSVASKITAALGSVTDPSYTFTGDTNTGMWSPGADTIAFSEGGVEAMRINSSGQVGIGETVPGARLHVSGGTVGTTAGNLLNVTIDQGIAGTNGVGIRTNLVRVSNGTDWTTTAMRLQGRVDATDFGYIDLVSGGAQGMAFGSGGAERMRIDATGNLLVGTTSATGRLTVQSAGSDVGYFDTTDTTGGPKVLSIRSIAASGTSTPTLAIRQWRTSFAGSQNAGEIRFDGLTTTGSYAEFASIYATSGANSASGAPTAITFQTMNASYATGERMRIDSAGNVGIGTTGGDFSRTWRFVARQDQNAITNIGVINANTGASASAQISKITGTGNSYVDWGLADNGGSPYDTFSYGSAVQYVSWGFGGSERMRLTSSGNVGIGTTGPTAKLDVLGDFVARTNASGGNSPLNVKNDSTANNTTKTTALLFQGADTVGTGKNIGLVQCGPSDANYVTSYLAFQTRTADALSERMRITNTGDVGIGTSVPLAKLFVDTTGLAASFAYIANGGGLYPVGVFGASFGYNFSSGGAEVDIWNGWTGATGTQGGFAFRRQTGASSQNLLMTIRGDGNVGIGTSAPPYQATVLGLGQDTAALTDAGNKGGSLYLQATGVTSGSGGAVLFGTTFGNQTPFAAIKGLVSDGSTNTTGDLAISTRNAIADTALSERIRINSAGNVGIGTSNPGYRLDIASGDTTASLGYAMRVRSNATATAATIQFTNSAVSAQNGTITCTDAGVMVLQSDGASSILAFRTNGNERFRILSTGGITSGDLADAVGYKGVPQNAQTSAYTLALSDMGKHISITTGGVVIPANGSVAFPIGSTITVYNNSASAQNISITTDTLRLAGTATTGTRSLAQRGLATCIKVAATEWVVTGNVT